MESVTSVLNFPSPSQPQIIEADLPTDSPSLLGRAHPTARAPILLCHPIAHNDLRWYRNFNLLSIAYAFRPRLRSRLTLSGRPSSGNLRFSADKILTCLLATYSGILTSVRPPRPYGHASAYIQNAPLPMYT